MASPSPRKKPNSVPHRSAARRARATRNASSRNTAATPRNPHSSPMAGSTRSVLPAGIMPVSPQPGPDPARSAGGKGPQRVRQLVAAVHVVVPRREPHVDALHHRARLPHAVPDGHRRHHQHHARHHQPGPPARHPEHREKHEEGHQRRPQVLQHEEQHQRHRQSRTAPAQRAPAAASRRARTASARARFSRKSRRRSQLRVK